MEGSERGLASFVADDCQISLPLEPQRAMTRVTLDLWRAVREVLLALLLMTAKDILTFRATNSHDERSVGLVEGGEGGHTSFVADGCHRSPDLWSHREP